MPHRAVSPPRTGDEEYIDIHDISSTSSVDNITAPPPVQAQRSVSNNVPIQSFGPEASRDDLRAVGPIHLPIYLFIDFHS